MQLITTELLDQVSEMAVKNPRRRINYNFHKSLEESVHRLLNAVEPGTYFPPHRHLNPDKDESLLVLRGSVLAFIFDNEGNIIRMAEIDPHKGCYGMEIEAGIWHSFIVLEPGTVLYEIKEGPFAPLTSENTAPWAPLPEEKEAVAAYMEKLMNRKNTD